MRSEDRLQSRCAMFAKSHVLPPTFWTAIEHGRAHVGTAEQRAREWQRLARKGVRTGLPDLLFITHGFVAAIELKVGTRQSDTQRATQEALEALGHGYSLVRSVEALGEALERHGIPLAPGWRVAAMHHDAALEAPPKGHNKPPRVAKPRGNKRQMARVNDMMLAMAKGGGE